MKNSKLTKLLALTLAFVLILSCCPTITLPVFAAVDAATAAGNVDALRYFSSSDLTSYQEWLTAMEGDDTYATQYSRLSAAITKLESGLDVYDDLSYIGTYATTGEEPENAFDAFPTSTNDSTWQIVWGGLSSVYTKNTYSWTNASSDFSANHLKFNPYHFSQYPNANGAAKNRDDWRYTTTGLNQDMSIASGYSWATNPSGLDMTTLLAGINWATPTYVDGSQTIDKVAGTLYARAWTSIIFDYKDAQNYSYLTMISGSGGSYYTYITAVVVENGKAVREIKLASIYGAAWQRDAFFRSTTNVLGDFVMEWDATNACYKLSINWAAFNDGATAQTYVPGATVTGDSGGTVSVLLNNNATRTAHGNADGDTSTDILSNVTAQRLTKVYVSGDGRNPYAYGSAPITNIGVAYNDCAHTNTTNSELVEEAATCLSNAVCIVICDDCGQFVGTYEVADSASGHSYDYTAVSDEQHQGTCIYGCGTTTTTENHNYGPDAPVAGSECIVCGYIYLESVVNSIKEKVDALNYFVAADLDTYKSWLSTMHSVSTLDSYADTYARLENAVEKIEANGYSVYDDMDNVGENHQDSSTTPENKFDPYPQVSGGSNENASWEIVWGGLESSGKASGNFQGYTLPATPNLALASSLFFTPYAYDYWINTYDSNSSLRILSGNNDGGLIKASVDFQATTAYKYLQASMNWATPVGSAHEGKFVESVSGTGRTIMAPAIIYNYVDANNFAYIIQDHAHDPNTDSSGNTNNARYTVISAVIVENGVARTVDLYNSVNTLMDGGWGLANSEHWYYLFDFDLTWSNDEGCYIYTIHFATSKTDESGDNGVSAPSHDKTLSFALKNTSGYGDLLASDVPTKLQKVYVNSSYEAAYSWSSTPFTQIGMVYSDYHVCNFTTDNPAKISDADCTTPAIYAKTCTECGMPGETYEVGNALGHSAAADAEWYSDASGHWQLCQYCGTEHVNAGNHDYGVYGENVGSMCYDCEYVYGADDLSLTLEAIKNIDVFRMENIADYEGYLAALDNIKETEYYKPYYDRVYNGVQGLLNNGNIYDDLTNIGAYVTDGTEPANKWDAFANTAGSDNNWQILWGGITANQAITAYSMPKAYSASYDGGKYTISLSETLYFSPFHFSNYTLTSTDGTTTLNSNINTWKNFMNDSYMDGSMGFTKVDYAKWGYYYDTTTAKYYDVTGIMAGTNWATPTYLSDDSGLGIYKVSGTGKSASVPTIIFDYKDPNNFSYVTMIMSNGGSHHCYITAVVVKDGYAIREVKLGQITNADWERYSYFSSSTAQAYGCFDFSMEWDPTEGCYKLDVVFQDINVNDQLTNGSSVQTPGKVVSTIYLKNDDSRTLFGAKDASDTSVDILTNSEATMLDNVYISMDSRNYASVPLLNIAITQLAKDHVHSFDQKVENSAHMSVAPDCSQTGMYYYSCECGANGTETFEGSTYGDHVRTVEAAYNASAHWSYCSVCYTTLDYEAHRMSGDSCSLCGYQVLTNVEKDFLPVIEGGKVLANTTPVDDQKLRIDVNFSSIINAANHGIEIVEYGVAVMGAPSSGVNVIELETRVKAGGEGVVSKTFEAGLTPDILSAYVDVGAANYGKRVALIAYVKTADGVYYFSENDVNSYDSNLSGALAGGVIQTSVMRIIKGILADTDTTTGYNQYIDSALATYYASGNVSSEVSAKCADADAAKTLLNSYLDGTVGASHADYEVAKEICLWTFRYCG